MPSPSWLLEGEATSHEGATNTMGHKNRGQNAHTECNIHSWDLEEEAAQPFSTVVCGVSLENSASEPNSLIVSRRRACHAAAQQGHRLWPQAARSESTERENAR